MNGSDDIELRWIFSVLRRWLFLIIGCAMLTGAVAYLATKLMPPTYKATTTLYIEPARDSKTSEYNVLIAGERLTMTYSQLVKEHPILEAVIDELNLKMSVGELADKITAEPVSNTQLIRLTARDADPQLAARIADAISKALVKRVQELQAERYLNSLTVSHQSIDELESKIEETRQKIDEQRSLKVIGEAELARQKGLLDENSNDLSSLQQNYQYVLLQINQYKNKVNLVETAHLLENQTSAPYTAVATFMLVDEQLARTYSEILTGRSVLDAAIQALQLQATPAELRQTISAAPIQDTQLVQLRVSASDANQAVRLAEAVANAFITQVRATLSDPYTRQLESIRTQMDEISVKMDSTQIEIETLTSRNIQADAELAHLETLVSDDRSDLQTRQRDYEQLQFSSVQAADSIVLASPASIPGHPMQNGMLYISLAVLIGLVIGGASAFLLEYLDDTVKSAEDITQKLGLSTIGIIHEINKPGLGVLVKDQPRSPYAEAFRDLATNIRYASLDRPIRSLLVTSSNPMEGKSLVAANLATAVAQGEQSVVLVDADLRLPTQHQRFALEQTQGLTEALLKNSVEGNLRSTQIDRLQVLTSGDLPPNPGEVIGSDRMHKMITKLTAKVDQVVVDSPPILVAVDAKALATEVDGVLLVIRAGQTTYQTARDAIESLRQVNANLIGAVLNGVHRPKKGYSYYHYPEADQHPGVSFWKRLQKSYFNFQGFLRRQEFSPRKWWKEKLSPTLSKLLKRT